MRNPRSLTLAPVTPCSSPDVPCPYSLALKILPRLQPSQPYPDTRNPLLFSGLFLVSTTFPSKLYPASDLRSLTLAPVTSCSSPDVPCPYNLLQFSLPWFLHALGTPYPSGLLNPVPPPLAPEPSFTQVLDNPYLPR